MTIYSIICGFRDFTKINDFMKLKEEYFTEPLGLKMMTTSHDYFSNISDRIDSKRFIEILM
ncbi:MAG: hypothetical protein PUB18_02050 [bacterium]|nr:hypothetical protein [bacterium]